MLELNDVVTTKKPHPCGSDKWLVVRIGADYKLKCLKCGHIVLLDSNAVKKAVKKIDKNRD